MAAFSDGLELELGEAACVSWVEVVEEPQAERLVTGKGSSCGSGGSGHSGDSGRSGGSGGIHTSFVFHLSELNLQKKNANWEPD